MRHNIFLTTNTHQTILPPPAPSLLSTTDAAGVVALLAVGRLAMAFYFQWRKWAWLAPTPSFTLPNNPTEHHRAPSEPSTPSAPTLRLRRSRRPADSAISPSHSPRPPPSPSPSPIPLPSPAPSLSHPQSSTTEHHRIQYSLLPHPPAPPQLSTCHLHHLALALTSPSPSPSGLTHTLSYPHPHPRSLTLILTPIPPPPLPSPSPPLSPSPSPLTLALPRLSRTRAFTPPHQPLNDLSDLIKQQRLSPAGPCPENANEKAREPARNARIKPEKARKKA